MCHMPLLWSLGNILPLSYKHAAPMEPRKPPLFKEIPQKQALSQRKNLGNDKPDGGTLNNALAY